MKCLFKKIPWFSKFKFFKKRKKKLSERKQRKERIIIGWMDKNDQYF